MTHEAKRGHECCCGHHEIDHVTAGEWYLCTAPHNGDTCGCMTFDPVDCVYGFCGPHCPADVHHDGRVSR